MLWLSIFQLSALQLDPMARLLVLAIAALAVITVRLDAISQITGNTANNLRYFWPAKIEARVCVCVS